MARGIATAGMVVAAGRCGLLGFFGSAGLDPAEVEDAIDAIRTDIPPHSPWGVNLIHSPDHSGANGTWSSFICARAWIGFPHRPICACRRPD